jgi:hypothetical protein
MNCGFSGYSTERLINKTDQFNKGTKVDKEELIKSISKHCSEEPCSKCKYAGLLYCQVQRCYDILKETGCLKEDINLPVKKTGVLKTADEVYSKTTSITFLGFGTVDNFSKNEMVSVKDGFEFLYKDIQETIDYSQIPAGSVVEFANKIYKEVISYERGYFRTVCDTSVYQSYPEKSLVKIIRWGK